MSNTSTNRQPAHAGRFWHSPPLESATAWLRSNVTAPPIGVDHDENVIRGYVVAQEGAFKTEGRGEFDQKGLKQIVRLMNATPKGLKSRFAHPTLSDDGIGKFLGRAHNARLETDRVRADLHLDPTSFDTPSGDLGGYVLRLAESDPEAFASSLVLKADELYRLDKKGRRVRDENGEELPPLWYPTELHASDVVDTGDAVDSFLSAGDLPDEIVRRGAELLDRQFPRLGREELRAHCLGWLERYLQWRYGPESTAMTDPRLRSRRRRLQSRLQRRPGSS